MRDKAIEIRGRDHGPQEPSRVPSAHPQVVPELLKAERVGVVGEYLGVDVRLPDPAGDEGAVVATEVQDGYAAGPLVSPLIGGMVEASVSYLDLSRGAQCYKTHRSNMLT